VKKTVGLFCAGGDGGWRGTEADKNVRFAAIFEVFRAGREGPMIAISSGVKWRKTTKVAVGANFRDAKTESNEGGGQLNFNEDV
jgi:hypothetical protein